MKESNKVDTEEKDLFSKYPILLSKNLLIIVASFLILVTIIFWLTTKKLVIDKRIAEMEINNSRIVDQTESHFERIKSNLYTLNSFIVNNKNKDSISPFRNFLKDAKFQEILPGVLLMGYSVVLKNTTEVKDLEYKQRLAGRKNFKVWPKSDAKKRSAVVNFYPQTDQNKHILGFDMYSESRRLIAMERAEKLQEISMTDPIVLILNDQKKTPSPSYIIYFPSYDNKNQKNELLGFNYIAIISNIFFKNILKSIHQEFSDYEFEIKTKKNNTLSTFDTLIYTTNEKKPDPSRLEVSKSYSIYGQDFIFTTWEKRKNSLGPTSLLPRTTLITGIIISTLIMFMIYLLRLIALRSNQLKDLALESAEKSQLANVAKSAFLANMSHEIRTPLSAILGYTDMLSEEGTSKTEKKEIVSTIRSNGSLLSRLLEDILDSSKIEAGQLSLDLRSTSLEVLQNQLQSVYNPKCQSKSLIFTVESKQEIPKFIVTDKHRLMQIISNLINNAIRFTNEGEIKVVFSVLAKEINSSICIDVIDTGIGVEEKYHEVIFEKFRQADISTTRKYGGTGLGLSLSKKLAMMMGGNIYLHRSALGSGSHFKVEIPLVISKGESIVPHNKSISNNFPINHFEGLFKDRKILIVEDTPENHIIFTFYMKNSGAHIDIAIDGNQGLEKGGTGEYDLILMDIHLPYRDGKEVTRILRQRGISCPIIALTAHAHIEEINSCLAAGCDLHLPKPTDQETLLNSILTLLQS